MQRVKHLEVIFQSTLPRGERLKLSNYHPLKYYFNPRSREGSDNHHSFSVPYIFISIHAPARGATIVTSSRLLTIVISIHAPARGATNAPVYVLSSDAISIHAPARGATANSYIFLSYLHMISANLSIFLKINLIHGISRRQSASF